MSKNVVYNTILTEHLDTFIPLEPVWDTVRMWSFWGCLICLQ